MLLTDIQTAVTDRLTTETIVTARLNRFIAAAVREYSRYNPIISSTMLSTVSDQAEYDLSALNCMQVLECYWWPIGQLFAELRAGAEQAYIMRQPYRYHMPSERVINDINQEAHISRLVGHWELRNQNTLVIYPTPTAASDEDLEIVYTSAHALNVGGTAYATIPDEDLDILADLTFALYLQARISEAALEPDYAEGLQRITTHFIGPNLQAAIRMLKQGVEGKYSGSGQAVAM